MLNTRSILWIAALLAAALGTYILYDANPGLNWGLWVAATSAGLIATRMAAGKPVRTHTYLLLSWATILAFAASVTAVDAHAPLIIATVAILLGITVTTLDDSALGITLPSVVQVPFTAVTRVGKEVASEIAALPVNARGLRSRPALRGFLLTVPVVLILVALLSHADPVLDSVRDILLGWMDNWVIDGRLVFFIVLALVTLGAYGLAAAARDQVAPKLNESEPAIRLGRAETKMLLYSVNAVLWIFVLLQLFALTRNPGAAADTGVSFAEYARRGFAELSVAAAFVLGVILVIEVFRKPEPGEKRRLELLAILAVVLILASAFRRVLLYEAAYGYTTDRLIAQVYMTVLAGAFIMLAWDLSRGAVSSAFGRHGMMLTLAGVTAFMYWNYEGWVVRQNLERASNGAELDVKYLNSLSLAAVPALVEGRNSLNAEQRAVLDSALRCKKLPDIPAWYERNVRVDAARAALTPFAGQCTNK